jgi:uncharacterized protein (DUF952 family)
VGTERDEGQGALGPDEHVFHIALAGDWERAVAAGDYRTSTIGRSLAEEGFIHASRRHQLDGIRRLFYSDVRDPLLLLEIDPSRLHVPLRLEVPPGADEAFPHVYGPLRVDAVVAVHDLD